MNTREKPIEVLVHEYHDERVSVDRKREIWDLLVEAEKALRFKGPISLFGTGSPSLAKTSS